MVTVGIVGSVWIGDRSFGGKRCMRGDGDEEDGLE